jgi:hypothetical protein
MGTWGGVVAAVIARLPSLQQLSMCMLPINMQAAATLGAAAAGAQLTQLKLDMAEVNKPGQLTDCSMIAIALGLTNLRSLELSYCNVGDAALPVLARLPLQDFKYKDCKFTTAAMRLFMPDRFTT